MHLAEKRAFDPRDREYQDIREFMRVRALEEITAILGGAMKLYSSRTPQELALLRAQNYERLGVLDLEEDAELFDSLTR